MMDAPIRMAAALRRDHRITGIADEHEVDVALGAAGLRVRLYPFRSELSGLLYRDTVYLASGLDAQTRKVIKAHELGHWTLGHGNMLFTSLTAAQMSVYGNRDERDAVIFTGAFLLGDPFDGRLDERLKEATDNGMPVDHLFAFFNAVSSAVGDFGSASD